MSGLSASSSPVSRHVTMVDDPIEPPAMTRDPKDDYLVALARAQTVDAIVSGDRDLLEAELSGVAVRTPRALGGAPPHAVIRTPSVWSADAHLEVSISHDRGGCRRSGREFKPCCRRRASVAS